MIKPAIDRQNREAGGEIGFAVSCEAVFFVEFVSGFEVGGGAEIDVLDATHSRLFKQMVEQFLGNASAVPPIIRGDKHFS